MAENYQPNQQITQLYATIGGGQQQASSFNISDASVKIATYGQLATASCKTSLSGLAAGIPPVDISQITNPTAQGANFVPLGIFGNGQQLFGGNYTHGLYTLHEDAVELWGRDFAGILFDSKQSLAVLQGGYQGLTVNQFVTNIATQFNLQSNVNSTLGATTMVGYLVNIAQAGPVMSTVPKSLWDFIVYLARWVGAQVYTTPAGVLTFTDSPAQPQIRNYMFAGTLTDVQNAQCLPVHHLTYLHQPQRNSNFAVCVISHHQKSVQVTAQTVFVAGIPITQTRNRTQPAGVYIQSSGRHLQSVYATAGLGIPVYYVRQSGKTPDQAQAQAFGLALDISARFLVCTMTVDFDPTLAPLQQVSIQAGSVAGSQNLYGFAARTLYITSINHILEVPQEEGLSEEGGAVSVIKALTLPPPTQQLDGAALAALGGE